MTDSPAFLDTLRQAAVAAQAEEIRFRASVAGEIAARERARAFGFRRLGLMTRLAAAQAGAEDPVAAATEALLAELGRAEGTPSAERIAEAFAPLAGTLPAAVAGEADPAPLLAAFEAWYQEAFGHALLSVYDQEPLEVPVVES